MRGAINILNSIKGFFLDIVLNYVPKTVFSRAKWSFLKIICSFESDLLEKII